MTTLALALSLALAAPGTPARNGRTTAPADAAAPAMADAEVASQVETYLGAIDTRIPAARWRALGDRAVGPLLAVVQGDRFPSQRARALDALSVVGGARAREALLAAARSEKEPFAVRASALRGAGRIVPEKELPGALATVLQSAREAPVRAVAAEVLAQHAPASACGAVRAQAAREAVEVRPAFGNALGRCGAAP